MCLKLIRSAQEAAELLASVRYILLDIDGVLWSGAHVIAGVPQTLQHLRACGKKIRFLTNNASLSRAEFLRKFQERGIDGVEESEVYNSGFAAALRLQRLPLTATAQQRKKGEACLVERNVFVIGERGLHDELRKVLAPGYVTYGLELHDQEKCGGYDANRMAAVWRERTLPEPLQQPFTRTTAGDNSGGVSLADLSPGAVVVGLDLHFNMLKLACASMCLQSSRTAHHTAESSDGKDVYFIATNEDPQIPIGESGFLLPGCGGIVDALCTVSGRRPDFVCGKPHVDMAEVLFEAEGITDPQQCLMIGDRLTTDIAFGNAVGCKTMLVLSGVGTNDDVTQAQRDNDLSLLPNFIAPSLAVFLPTA